MYYRTYTCISNHIHVIQNLYLSYGTYTGLTEHILIIRILSLCEGTRRYNKSKRIIIISHTRSDQTYADTYQVWTLVFRRYRSKIQYTEVPVGTTALILNLQNLYLFSDTRVPVGNTELNQIQEYP